MKPLIDEFVVLSAVFLCRIIISGEKGQRFRLMETALFLLLVKATDHPFRPETELMRSMIVF